MAQWKHLRRFFWEQVADALRLEDWQITQGRFMQDMLVGSSGGFTVETGAYWYWKGFGEEQREEEFTFASVSIQGLPPGLEIEGPPFIAPYAQVRVPCEDGRSKKVRVKAVPLQLGGLRLEQVSVDLDTFITPARREAICSLESGLLWAEDRHRVRVETRGLPYPPERTLTDAVAGDVGAMQEVRESRDRVVALVQTVVRDAKIIARELHLEQGDSLTDNRNGL